MSLWTFDEQLMARMKKKRNDEIVRQKQLANATFAERLQWEDFCKYVAMLIEYAAIPFVVSTKTLSESQLTAARALFEMSGYVVEDVISNYVLVEFKISISK